MSPVKLDKIDQQKPRYKNNHLAEKKDHDIGTTTVKNVTKFFLSGQVPTPLIYIITLLA